MTIEGVDETTSQPVTTRHHWDCGEIRWNYRYEDLFRDGGEGRRIIDYRVFHDVRPTNLQGHLSLHPGRGQGSQVT